MDHHTARLIAGRTNGIGRRLGCSCCNSPRRLVPTFARTVRTKIKRVGAEEIVDALAPADPNADVCDGSCPDCSGRNDIDKEPVHFNDDDGDRWRFPDEQPYCDAP